MKWVRTQGAGLHMADNDSIAPPHKINTEDGYVLQFLSRTKRIVLL